MAVLPLLLVLQYGGLNLGPKTCNIVVLPLHLHASNTVLKCLCYVSYIILSSLGGFVSILCFNLLDLLRLFEIGTAG